MRYELSHDSIARLVFSKASTEAQTRRKVEKYIRDRHEAYLNREVKLTQDDIDFIHPYLAQVNISAAEAAFVEQGRRALIAGRRRRRVLVGAIVLVMAAFSVGSFMLYQNAERAKDDAIQESLRADSLASVAQFEAQNARTAQLGDSLARVKADSALLVAVNHERQANQAKEDIQEQLIVLQAEKAERVTSILKRFPQKIIDLDYTGAATILKEAKSIKANPQEVKQAATELIYYYGEIGKYSKAYAMLEEVEEAYGLNLTAAVTDSSVSVKQKLSRLADEKLLSAFQEKYYPKMIAVQGGVFIMGDDSSGYKSEKPEHWVKFSNFSIAQTELTVWQYMLYAQSQDITLPDPPSWGWKGNHPMVNVSWAAAQAYAQWLRKKTGQSYRLPTEAEWEFAAGGGLLGRDPQGKRQYQYAGSNDIDAVAHYRNNSNSTMPVAGKQANQLGLYDMSGNVYEWCSDWYTDDYYAQCAKEDTVINPVGPGEGDTRVRRGGSWLGNPLLCRSASRFYYGPEYRDTYLGFRLVLSPR